MTKSKREGFEGVGQAKLPVPARKHKPADRAEYPSGAVTVSEQESAEMRQRFLSLVRSPDFRELMSGFHVEKDIARSTGSKKLRVLPTQPLPVRVIWWFRKGNFSYREISEFSCWQISHTTARSLFRRVSRARASFQTTHK